MINVCAIYRGAHNFFCLFYFSCDATLCASHLKFKFEAIFHFLHRVRDTLRHTHSELTNIHSPGFVCHAVPIDQHQFRFAFHLCGTQKLFIEHRRSFKEEN